MYLIFDTETTGLPKNWNASITDTDNWPRCIQLAWQLHDKMGNLIEHQDFLIIPEGFNIPYDAEQIHGISTQLAQEKGKPLSEVLVEFNEALAKTNFVVGQNVNFDLNVLGCEFYRQEIYTKLNDLPVLDTCTEKTAELCQIPGGRGGKYKLPTLTELYEFLFKEAFKDAHNATADVEATARCFFELIRNRAFRAEELDVAPDYFEKFNIENAAEIELLGLRHSNLKKESKKIKQKLEQQSDSEIGRKKDPNLKKLEKFKFAHLHNHSQFSILQSTSSIEKLVKAAADERMPAVALTDSGNMMGAFSFVKEVLKYNKNSENPIKPIVGCEYNLCEDHQNRSVKDNGYQIVLLAKNKRGYHNLAKMSSIAYIDGFYYVPRIDKDVIEKYKEDIIALSGNIYGEIPGKILNVGEKQAEEALLWWKETFGDDFYLELNDHQQENEQHVNEVLIDFAKRHKVKLVATNNTYYIDKKDAESHDILLCVKDGEKQATPKGKGRGFRFGLPNNEYYFKSQDEMKQIFHNIPEAIINIQDIVDKIEIYSLERDVLLPKFDIPKEFIDKKDDDGGKRGENAYLKYLTLKGAEKRYGKLDAAIEERINFELKVIENTGYPGYFLIVQDFISKAREMGVSVGPGRGSAAGSAVAYCLRITNIDP
ncbi:MAG: PHP domain-containing protein, partial [Flavobacteriaceae bacterium]|nr:PHP domain-containing protein [Flavobacteriaceae bacterium]